MEYKEIIVSVVVVMLVLALGVYFLSGDEENLVVDEVAVEQVPNKTVESNESEEVIEVVNVSKEEVNQSEPLNKSQ